MKLNLGLLLATQAVAVLSAAAPPDQTAKPPSKSVDALGACWTDTPYGCSKDGWCYKQCGGGGEWCWLAYDGGSGRWKSCGNNNDCKPGMDSADCGQGGCDACGCSC